MNKSAIREFAIESRKDLMNKINLKIKMYYVEDEFSIEKNGDLYLLKNKLETLTLTPEEYKNRELLVKRIKEIGIEQVIEESAYTWFNRLIAIRYMEIHDFLPLGKNNESLSIRVLSSNDNTPNPEILKFSNLINNELDINFNQTLYTNFKNDNEKFKYILLLVCNKLKKVFPNVFDGITDYIDLLVPENMLSETGFVSKMLNILSEADFNEVEILGWLYQFYISENTDLVYDGSFKKEKLDKTLIPAATQIFTPDWVVKTMVENTILSKWYEINDLENFSSIDFEYFFNLNLEKENIRTEISNLKFIDPCCGSGHILVYAFEVFYKMYLMSGYNKKDIPFMILNNNLFGLDIDDRAGQLSFLSILLKAREYDKEIFNKNTRINIMSLQDTNEIVINDFINNELKEKIIELLDLFKDAKEIGSLIKVKKDYSFIIDKLGDDLFEGTLKHKLIPIVNQALILMNKYDFVVTNPPYLTSTRMSNSIINYSNKEYIKSNKDLCTMFIENGLSNLGKENGYLAYLTPSSWITLKNFKELRELILNHYQIKLLIDYGSELFDGKVGHNQIVLTIFKKCNPKKTSQAIDLKEYSGARKKEKLTEIFNKDNYYYFEQEDMLKMPLSAITYKMSTKLIDIIAGKRNYGDLFDVNQGLATADNDRFLRFWWEVERDKIKFDASSKEEAIKSSKKWFSYNKGGLYRKWYGNNEYVINWENNGVELKNFKKSVIRNEDNYFKECISWSKISSGDIAFRYKDKGNIFDVSGTSIFSSDHEKLLYLLGLSNSSVILHILKQISPTLNYEVGQIASLPYDEFELNYVVELVEKAIDIVKEEWDDNEISYNFKTHPLIKHKKNTLFESVSEYKAYINEQFEKLRNIEEEINQFFVKKFNLENEVEWKVKDSSVSIQKLSDEKIIKSFINYFVGCLFGRYDSYKEIIDDDNILPINISSEIYYADDIVIKFKNFIKLIFGTDNLEENLEYIANTLDRKGTELPEETIRKYFINDFYNEHCRMFQKKPIYWMIDSGKYNGFKALIYVHKYDKSLLSKVRVNYLHKTQDTYNRIKENIEDNIFNQRNIKENQNSLNEINNILNELNIFDEKLGHLANQMIAIDLDQGISENYKKMAEILSKTK